MADSVLRRILDWLHLNPIAFTDLLEDHLLHFYVQIKGRCPKGLGFFYGCPLFGLFSLRGMKSFSKEVLKELLISCCSLSPSLEIG